MMLKISLLSTLASALVLVSQQAVAAPTRLEGFVPAGNDTRPVIRADPSGKLQDSLLNERGELLNDARIVLESRQNPGFAYGSQKVRGVNIGGWLVAEPWITPSLFDNTGDGRVIDEYTFGQYASNAYGRLQAHWASFYTESDFAQIAGAGLNHVRIPIGYWAFDTSAGEPYVRANQADYLERAIQWSRKYGLKVIIDLHGAPGSQNGFDNSGRKGAVNWPNDQNNANRAVGVIAQIARRYAKYGGTVTSIELLNEPAGFVGGNIMDYTKSYYTRGIQASRASFYNAAVMIHDAFLGTSYWNGQYQPPQYQQILLDTHIYQVFSPAEVARNHNDRLNTFCSQAGGLAASNRNLWTIVGEWSTAPTDCAKYLNGRFVGARYDGSFPGSYYVGSCSRKTGDGSNFSTNYKASLKRLFETQISVYERASGWIMWTWKTEQAADWDYQKGLQYGWITRNLNSRPNARC
ncbi:Glycoside hydrolase, family 5 [Kalmanozyma brasiliensis GHG001]|uniref:glucan 1,3-beta-glucosidase n=1 Tax=Kalmanozyma brasiliensis (strain GHG001) TaxID=1365824 RepID=V5F301_KALBG|nr:Glycoside hydrolase, family 5 [Kalmanozyma brasiliensis GHG001]EST09859.1 Glycoside hydrolase, family 5 [Kalmanozyma brasiliensis GHG001]